MSCHIQVATNNIDATLLLDVQGLFSDLPDAWYITDGWRSIANEEAKYQTYLAGGPKATKPSNSAHVGANFADGKSRAIDCTLVIDGKDNWDVEHPSWQEMLAKVKVHPRLHSLVDIGDFDHIEKVGWHKERIK